MKRRSFLSLGTSTLGTAALAATPFQQASAQITERVGFLLVHGSWHGGWCWGKLAPYLHEAGFETFTLDLPGHGLDTVLPAAFSERPLQAAAFASAPSALAAYNISDYADAVVAAALQAKATGVDRLYLVGHSMGGVPISFDATKAPELFSGLIYIAALTPTPGKPAGAYLQLPEQVEGSQIGAVLMADPGVVGALRIDPRSTDPNYLAQMTKALAHDVDPHLLEVVRHLLTPDAPVSIYGEVAHFPAAFGRLRRGFIICSADQVLIPSTAEAMIADMDVAWPEQPTRIWRLNSSHEAMFSAPASLAQMIMKTI